MSNYSGYENSTAAGDAYGYPMGEQQENVSLFKTGPQMAESIVAAQQRGDVTFTGIGGNQPIFTSVDVHPFANPIAEYFDGSSISQKLHAVAYIPGRVDAKTGLLRPGEHYGIVGTYDSTSNTNGLLLVRFPKKEEGDVVLTSYSSHLDPTVEVRPSRLIDNVQITFDTEMNRVSMISHDGRPCTIATPAENGKPLNMSETGDAWTLTGLGQAAKPERIAERRADKERAMQYDTNIERQVPEWRAEAHKKRLQVLLSKGLFNEVVTFDEENGTFKVERDEQRGGNVYTEYPTVLIPSQQTSSDELWLPPTPAADPAEDYRRSSPAYAAYSNEESGPYSPPRRHRSLIQRIKAHKPFKRPAFS
ncbi:MAG TPA: hypothetical protein VLG16_00210 [Candidatus Saccharimonadales bacterium]|nr:hypothetical protein [Candidatus Saccharimonadales bacterium]